MVVMVVTMGSTSTEGQGERQAMMIDVSQVLHPVQVVSRSLALPCTCEGGVRQGIKDNEDSLQQPRSEIETSTVGSALIFSLIGVGNSASDPCSHTCPPPPLSRRG